jgi:hypothetical protein
MDLNSSDDGRAYTSGPEGLSSRRNPAFQLNGFLLKYGAVFIRVFKLPSEKPPGCTSAAAIANVFTAQAKLRDSMRLFEMGRLKDDLFFINKILYGKIRIRPINTGFQEPVRCYAHTSPAARGTHQTV